MKSILILALAGVFTIGATTVAEAGGCRTAKPVYTKVSSCKPAYVCTKVVASRTECRWAVDKCGRRYSYEVKVVTYADVYSDGTQRRYTKVYAA